MNTNNISIDTIYYKGALAVIHSQRGFSTVEFIITVLIVAITVAVVIPNIANVFAALGVNQTKGAAEQVASAIEQTRAYAILQSAQYRMRLPGANQVQIDCFPVGQCPDLAPGEGPTRLVNNGVVATQGGVDAGCGGDWCIWFKSTGTSIAKSIIVNPGPYQRTVTVTVAGRVRVTVP